MNRRTPTLGSLTLGAMALSGLLVGCQGQKNPEPAAQPFVFRSLNLKQHNFLGPPTRTQSKKAFMPMPATDQRKGMLASPRA